MDNDLLLKIVSLTGLGIMSKSILILGIIFVTLTLANLLSGIIKIYGPSIDSASNLFAGFHIIVAKQKRIGDYIRLETGEEGYVVDINWRSTKIKMLPNNLVLVLNDKLNKAIKGGKLRTGENSLI